MIKSEAENESQMDKIKYTLDDLRLRINEMRKKFRQFTIKAKRTAVKNNQEDDSDLDDDETEKVFKLCIYVKEQAKILTFSVNPRFKIRDLKHLLFEQVADQKNSSIDDMILSFNNSELSNDSYTLQDYKIADKSTITLEFDR